MKDQNSDVRIVYQAKVQSCASMQGETRESFAREESCWISKSE